MKPEEFKSFWQTQYPEAYPIGYELKWIYSNRWFRIHSLPDSKRYAESTREYQILLSRQNEIISDLIGEEIELIFLFGLYAGDLTNDNYHQIDGLGKFNKVETLDLHKIRPEEYEETFLYDIFIKTTKWKSNEYNSLLKLIADFEIKMMFICPEKNRIINPYDGGVDIIMETEQLRDITKQKYYKWLSKHPEEL